MAAVSATINAFLAAISSPPVFVGCIILTYFLYEKRDDKFFKQGLRTWLTILVALIVLSGVIRASGLGHIAGIFRIRQQPQGLVNTSLGLAGNSYNVNPYRLQANDTLKVVANVTGPGGINLFLLNASEYEQFQSGNFNLTPLQFTNSSHANVRQANFTLSIPYSGKYYLVLSTASLLPGQVKYNHLVDLDLQSYVIETNERQQAKAERTKN